MELSELVWWSNKYLAVCDYTGIVYKVRPRQGDIFPRFVLADGDGKSQRTLKAEWATAYRSSLIIGGHGKEWVDDGVVLSRASEWVKVIEESGAIRSVDWHDRYALLRNSTGTLFPGYMSHEAVVFNPFTRQWVFAPRKVSVGVPYSDEADERLGSNLLLVADEHFTKVDVRRVGPHEPTWGFTSLALVPGSQGRLLVGLKVEELGPHTRTKLTVFDLDGRIVLEPEFVPTPGPAMKFEGVEFLGEHENW